MYKQRRTHSWTQTEANTHTAEAAAERRAASPKCMMDTPHILEENAVAAVLAAVKRWWVEEVVFLSPTWHPDMVRFSWVDDIKQYIAISG